MACRRPGRSGAGVSRKKRRSGSGSPLAADFRTFFDQARRSAYLLGWTDAGWLRLTPGELSALLDVYAERTDADWLRTAMLAVWVRATIWAEKGPTAYELLGREAPTIAAPVEDEKTEAAQDALWEQVLQLFPEEGVGQ